MYVILYFYCNVSYYTCILQYIVNSLIKHTYNIIITQACIDIYKVSIYLYIAMAFYCNLLKDQQ